MSGLILTLKEPPRQRLDLSALTEKGTAAKNARETARIPIFFGNQKARLGDLFKVSGSPGMRLTIRNSTDKLDGIGAGLRDGELIVKGDAGAYLGRNMSGGRITVDGHAGDFTACGLRGGEILVKGNSGDFLGAALAGEKAGMNGGVVRIAGNAGERTGDQMRRGILLVEGDVGSHCASRMVAGSIAVLGKVGPNLGLAMKRGTVLLVRPPTRLPATFNDCGSHALPFFHLFLAHLKSLGGAFSVLDPSKDRLRRYSGDLSVDGKGEILFYEK